MQTTGPVPCTYAQQAAAVANLERAAMSGGDMNQYCAILAEDAVFLPPNTTAKSGAELRAWLKDFLDHFEVEWLKWADGETVVVGDFAYYDYAYSMRSTPRDGGDPVIGNGKGLEVLRRHKDGVWRIVRNIWNAAPAP